ncbi:MAG: HEAT repeat domain-containing protein, partial [Planctomycetota bacterium]
TRVLEAALKERDPRVLVCACDAVGLGNRQKMAPRLLQLLQRRSVPVQVAVLQALAAMRYEEAAPQVLRIFCGTESHRVRFEAWQTLEHLTREDHGPDPGAWKAWFDEQVAAVGEEAPNPWGTHFPTVKGTVAKPARFFRIPVMADRLCFVLDTSGDMDNAWKIDPKLERKKPREERTPSMFTVKTRWQLVRAHVKRCLEQLPPETEIAFVFYYNRIFVYPDTGRYLKNSERNRRRVLEHLEKHVKRDGTTAMYEGLRRGWGFLKDGDAKANFRKGCDTILFVTDGRPTSGALKDRADRLRDEVWRAATPRRLRIHTVGLYNHAFELLKQIAKDTGGLYVHAQEVGDPAEPQDLDFWPEKKKAFEAARKAARKGP